jgi:hypothetical protein
LLIRVSKHLFIWHNSHLPRLFDPTSYGKEVETILSLDGAGERLMPLAITGCSSEEARRILRSKDAAMLFTDAPHGAAAMSGLWLYFSCFDESHSISQDIPSPEGSFWHGILHRQEPDAGNAGYWFRRVGKHPVFERLNEAAQDVIQTHPGTKRFEMSSVWDPFQFIDFCEYARTRPGSEDEQLAREIQRAEWQLLFDYCARPRV